MNLSIIIPVFNEEKNVEKVLKKVVANKYAKEIIIVNDGSSDNTKSILEKTINKNSKIKIINHTINQGKGAAIITGLKSITKEFVLIQDADLEYNPDEYGKLIEKASDNIVVYGSRLITHNKHAYTRTYFGNILLTSLFNLIYGTKITDSYTCYKLLPTKVAKSLKLKSNGFEIEAEITAKLAKQKIQIIEVPISYSPRKYEDGKKIKAFDALKGIITMVKVYFDTY